MTAYAGDSIAFETAGDATITDDTVIIYVDIDENEGLEGGKIAQAVEDENGDLDKNVYVEVNGDKEVTYLFVSLSNTLTPEA